jgi:hypothetical protein
MVGSRSTVETKLGSSAACLRARVRRVVEKKRLVVVDDGGGRAAVVVVVVADRATQHGRVMERMLLRIGCCSLCSTF